MNMHKVSQIMDKLQQIHGQHIWSYNFRAKAFRSHLTGDFDAFVASFDVDKKALYFSASLHPDHRHCILRVFQEYFPNNALLISTSGHDPTNTTEAKAQVSRKLAQEFETP